MGCMEAKTSQGVCQNCGFDDSSYDVNYLKPGTYLDTRYMVGALKSVNGEGATYLGYDNKKEAPVIIREYFPTTIAQRELETGEVLPISGHGAQYKALLSDFVELCNEARRLSVSDPVIPVENMLGSNNTVYVIYTQLDVITLEEYIENRGGQLFYEDALDLLIPLLNGMDNIHLRGIIHRGLSPQTVMVDSNNRIYIDGFCLSATRTGGSELEAELFNGFSAPEQYSLTGWQGTWTDVYALACIFYRTISGVVPPKSTRVKQDRPLISLKDLVPGVPDNLSDAVENAMVLSTQNRTQTVASLLSEMIAQEGVAKTEVFDPGRIPVTLQPMDIENEFGKADFSGFDATEEISDPLTLEAIRGEIKRESETQALTFVGDTDPVEEDYSYEEYAEQSFSSKTRNTILVILGVGLLVGIILAVFISGKLGLGKKDDLTGRVDATEPPPVVETQPDPEPQPEVPARSQLPDLVGKKLDTVEHNPDYANYVFTIKYEYSNRHAEGLISEQSPPPGTDMPKGGTVVLTVSKGNKVMTMPEIVGLSPEDAKKILAEAAKEAGLTYEELKITTIEKFLVGATQDEVSEVTPRVGTEFNPLEDRIQISIAKAPPADQSTETPKEKEKEDDDYDPPSGWRSDDRD